jgi:hypothetical protein
MLLSTTLEDFSGQVEMKYMSITHMGHQHPCTQRYTSPKKKTRQIFHSQRCNHPFKTFLFTFRNYDIFYPIKSKLTHVQPLSVGQQSISFTLVEHNSRGEKLGQNGICGTHFENKGPGHTHSCLIQRTVQYYAHAYTLLTEN